MSGTTVDATLQKLVALFGQVAPAGWQIIDGRPYEPRRSFIAVGWAGMDSSAVITERSPSNAAASASIEDYTVICQLSRWSGKDLNPKVRAEAFAALDDIDRVLSADPMLEGSVMFANLADYEYIPYYATEGACARIHFSVHVRAQS